MADGSLEAQVAWIELGQRGVGVGLHWDGAMGGAGVRGWEGRGGGRGGGGGCLHFLSSYVVEGEGKEADYEEGGTPTFHKG